MADVVIRDPLVLRVADRLVIVISFWMEADDVPGVEKAGYVAQHAKEDINQGVDRAYPRFDPYCCPLETGHAAQCASVPTCNWGKQDGDKPKEDIAATHFAWCVEVV